MPEKRVKIDVPGLGLADGVDVPITEATERWTELTLADGSVLRVKPNVLSVVRLEGRYDPEGNPMYAVRGQQVMVVASAPDHLRRTAGSKGVN